MSVYDHPDWRAFVAAVRENPEDDLPRLVAADWLDEHGQAERAEFVRGLVEMHRASEAGHNNPERRWDNPHPPDCDGCHAAWGLAKQLYYRFGEPGQVVRWASELVPLDWRHDPGDYWYAVRHPDASMGYERGFVDALTCPAETWVAHGDRILTREPVREVFLMTWPGRITAVQFAEAVGWVIPAEWYPAGASGTVCRMFERERHVRAMLGDRWPGVKFEMPPAPPEPNTVRVPRGRLLTAPSGAALYRNVGTQDAPVWEEIQGLLGGMATATFAESVADDASRTEAALARLRSRNRPQPPSPTDPGGSVNQNL